jgi:ribonucleoside-triphosphate reductase
MKPEQIDQQIAELRKELPRVRGRKTEVMQRIVGYYRDVRHWNNGKAEEYEQRKVYQVRV